MGRPVDDVLLGGVWDGSWLASVSSTDGVEVARAIESRVVEAEARVDIAVYLASMGGEGYTTPKHTCSVEALPPAAPHLL